MGGLIDRTPERLVVTDEGLHGFGVADLGTHPVLEKSLSKLSTSSCTEQQPEAGVCGRFGDLGAEQLVERLAVPLLLLCKKVAPTEKPCG